MSRNKLRLLVLTHGGIEIALERLLALDCAEVAGVFIETDVQRRVGWREKLRRSIRYDGYAATCLKFARTFLPASRPGDHVTIEKSRTSLREFAEAAGVPVHLVRNYH